MVVLLHIDVVDSSRPVGCVTKSAKNQSRLANPNVEPVTDWDRTILVNIFLEITSKICIFEFGVEQFRNSIQSAIP